MQITCQFCLEPLTGPTVSWFFHERPTAALVEFLKLLLAACVNGTLHWSNSRLVELGAVGLAAGLETGSRGLCTRPAQLLSLQRALSKQLLRLLVPRRAVIFSLF